MRTPWMQTTYRCLSDSAIDVEQIDREHVRVVDIDASSSFVLTNLEYESYREGSLDYLVMENMYYRGLALDDQGNKLMDSQGYLSEGKYVPLNDEEYVSFNLVVSELEYTIMLNPEVGSWVAFEDGEFEDYKNGRLSPLKMENLYLRKLAVDEDLEAVEMDFPEPAEQPSVVVVNLTMTCNLRCKYCFAGCEPGQGDFMPEEVMERVIIEMFKMPSKLITFELQGGEPLCYFEGMKKFVAISEKYREQYGKLVQYRTVTNATLITDEVIEFAKRYHIAVCVSLDGDEGMTNQTRVYADGRGAFAEIMAGVNKLKSQYKVDGAVCTIGQHNMRDAKKIMNFFIEQGISFKPRPANILGRELENHTTTRNGEWAKAFITMHKMTRTAPVENYSVHIYEENVYGPVRDYICLRYPCGAAREVISVNPDGAVYPCDGFKNEEKFNMGNIKEEALDDILSKAWVAELRGRTYKDIKKCSKCMFRAMCCSCCYSAYGAYGTVYREDPQCEDRRNIFLYLIKAWLEKNAR